MADIALLLEAEKRGLLPTDKVELLSEARRRGLVPSDTLAVPSAPTIAAPSKSGLERGGDTIENVVGSVAEPVARLITAPVAKVGGQIAGTLKGVYDAGARSLGYGQQGDNAEEMQRRVERFIQSEPTTSAGKSEYNPLNAIPNAVGKAIGWVGDKAANIVAPEKVDPNADFFSRNNFQRMAADAVREAVPQAAGFVGVTKAPAVIRAVDTAATPVYATGRAVRNVADRLLPGGSARGEMRIMADAAGSDLPALIDAVRNAKPGETSGQAAAGIGRREFSALDQLGAKIAPTEYGRMMEAQKNADLAMLLREAGGLNKESQLAVQQALKDAETRPIVAQGQVELNAANQAGDTLASLAPRMEQKQQSMVQALQDQGRTATEAAVQENLAHGGATQSGALSPSAYPVQGQPRVPGRYTENIERVPEYQAASGDLGIIKAQRQMERDFIDRQIGSLEAHGLKPLDISAVTGKIDKVLNSPGLRMSDQTQTVLGGLRDKFREAEALGNGIPNAHDIYQIRKEGINEIVQQKLAGLDPKVSKKLVADLTTQLKPFIDNAIETAGGSGWKKYLDDYSTAMDKVNQVKLHGKLADAYQNQPGVFEKLVMGNDPKTVGKIMGSTSPMSMAEAIPQTAQTLRSMGEAQIRNRTLAEHAQEGAPALSNMVTAEVTGGGRLPGMVSRETTWANAILDALHGRANEKTLKQVAATMRNPEATVKVLEAIRAKNAPRQPSQIYQGAVTASMLPQPDQKKLAEQLRKQQ